MVGSWKRGGRRRVMQETARPSPRLIGKVVDFVVVVGLPAGDAQRDLNLGTASVGIDVDLAHRSEAVTLPLVDLRTSMRNRAYQCRVLGRLPVFHELKV